LCLLWLIVLGADHASAQYIGPLNQAFELLKAARYAEAIPFAEQAVRVASRREDQARALVLLANLRSILGQFDQSEPLYKRAIALQETALGPEHADISNSLGNLGRLYFEMGRYDEAGQLFRRAHAIAEKVYQNSPYMITSHLKNLADVYRVQGRPKEAEPLLERAVAIWQEQYGDKSALLAEPLAQLADLYYSEGRYAEAELLLSRAIELHEAQFNTSHPNFGRMLLTLGSVQQAQRRSKQAEANFQRALSIWQKSLSPYHPYIVEARAELASLYLAQSQPALALRQSEEAVRILMRRGPRLAAKGTASTALNAISNAAVFRLHVVALYRAGISSESAQASFLAAQRGRQTETANALSQMAERHLGATENLSVLIRERQDLERQWRAADQGLSSALGSSNGQSAAAARGRLVALDKRLGEIEREIAQRYPEFASFTGAAQLSIKEVQALLKPDEVAVQFLETPEIGQSHSEMFAWVVGKDEFRWEKLPRSPQEIETMVATLRCGLDEQVWDDSDGRARCSNLTAGMPSPPNSLPFDVIEAHALFEALFAPFKEQIAAKKLLIVPSERLMRIPLGVLITEKVKGFPVYAEVNWLATQNAMTILPSISSLQALRKFARGSRAAEPFIGFGDPLLRGNDGCARAAVPSRCPTSEVDRDGELVMRGRGTLSRTPVTKFYKQRVVDIAALQSQCPLPETAFELGCVAQSLGASAASLNLREKATEKVIKSSALQNYRVVHFATHGLLAIDTQQVSGGTLVEPALLFTPPATPTELDDGLLTASEIMQLKLDADWVVLSACNTAGGDKIESGEALSGLARAFFYAGARALLVSHWAVDSNAAVRLTTRSFTELKSDPGIGPAEALRRSMLQMIKTRAEYQSHPAYWAAFSIVGIP
jgi:CHAT domain-containing protein/tetratricopeptide (TPR) repeat protein